MSPLVLEEVDGNVSGTEQRRFLPRVETVRYIARRQAIYYLFICGNLALFGAAGFEITPLRACLWNGVVVLNWHRTIVFFFRFLIREVEFCIIILEIRKSSLCIVY